MGLVQLIEVFKVYISVLHMFLHLIQNSRVLNSLILEVEFSKINQIRLRYSKSNKDKVLELRFRSLQFKMIVNRVKTI